MGSPERSNRNNYTGKKEGKLTSTKENNKSERVKKISRKK